METIIIEFEIEANDSNEAEEIAYILAEKIMEEYYEGKRFF